MKKAFDSKEDIHWEDVHVVTQLVNSLLGIVVVPKERDLKKLRLSKTLNELYKQKWPQWNIPCGRDACDTCCKCTETATLKDLIKRLRNAAAHGHFDFVGDPFVEDANSRDLEKVRIVVRDKYPNDTKYHWCAEISGPDLYLFCLKFLKHIEECLG